MVDSIMYFKYDRHIWRQIFILTSACFSSITAGIMFAHTGVLTAAILAKNNTDISVTPDEASWMAASTGFSGILGFFILTPIFQILGRKPAHICMGVITLFGWIMLSVARDAAVILAARIIQGISFGGTFIVGMTIGEYAHPKRRGYFLTIKKASVVFGSLICYSLSMILTWRQIAVFAVVTSTISVIAVPFWPESPAFLAMTGRFQQCREAYFWLNEKSIENEKELQELITAQVQRIENKNNLQGRFSYILKIVEQLLKPDFLKPCLIVTVLSLCIDSCGKYFLMSYITQIIVQVTADDMFAKQFSIYLNGLLVLAICLSSVLIRYFKMRTLFFCLGLTSTVLMFLISLVIILQSNNVIAYVVWTVPLMILLHGFISHVGIIPIAFVLSSEVFPLEHRGLGACVSGVIFTSLYAFTTKLTPIMLLSIGIEGTYGIYGVFVLTCLVILYFYLPETKNKTLQDIEKEIKGL